MLIMSPSSQLPRGFASLPPMRSGSDDLNIDVSALQLSNSGRSIVSSKIVDSSVRFQHHRPKASGPADGCGIGNTLLGATASSHWHGAMVSGSSGQGHQGGKRPATKHTLPWGLYCQLDFVYGPCSQSSKCRHSRYTHCFLALPS